MVAGRNSLKREADGITVQLHRHGHGADACLCTIEGILPDLFKEGKGVVAQGKLAGNDHRFVARGSAGQAR